MLLVGMEMAQLLWKESCNFLQNETCTYHMTLHNLSLLDIIEEMLKTYARKNKTLYKNIHSSSFVIAPNWKQPRRPSMGEWLNKLVHPHLCQFPAYDITL